MTKTPRFIPAPEIERRSDEELMKGAFEFFQMMQRRRTVRDFSDRAVPPEVIEHCIRAAGTAPSGANLQPWHFVAVSDPRVKHEIRVAAEAEEKEFYERRAPKAWLDALATLSTDWHKPFLETAPWLIAVFAQPFRNASGWDAVANLLSAGVGLHRYWIARDRASFLRACGFDTHAQSDGVPE